MPILHTKPAGMGDVAALSDATLTDIEKKRHKKNPFDGRYLQFCLLGFDQVGCSSVDCVALWTACGHLNFLGDQAADVNGHAHSAQMFLHGQSSLVGVLAQCKFLR